MKAMNGWANATVTGARNAIFRKNSFFIVSLRLSVVSCDTSHVESPYFFSCDRCYISHPLDGAGANGRQKCVCCHISPSLIGQGYRISRSLKPSSLPLIPAKAGISGYSPKIPVG